MEESRENGSGVHVTMLLLRSIAELERSFAASTIDLTMDEDVNLLEEDEGRGQKTEREGRGANWIKTPR
ncbi:hypothetical protein DAPPUDRAFT_266858 [Daphnia pulex]|uniref:Uncharacterized protein n=1 Tax=Daphnia pulex TaxID=6669 RepID=E9HVN6_DAPPU|nr:hypothetical protein DAPPUDRAFT_266858 [Daphnia pulex]|eukprot:EFX64203.1 hypothetical protein DAPPUDRAFT_266858 [Daphnia pulex]